MNSTRAELILVNITEELMVQFLVDGTIPNVIELRIFSLESLPSAAPAPTTV